MLKTHMLISPYGFARCGRNVFDNYLVSVDYEEEVTCKTCKRLTKRVPDVAKSGDGKSKISGKRSAKSPRR